MKLPKRYFIRTSLVFFAILAFSGCSILKGTTDSIAGNYMDGLEKTRKNSTSQIFDYGIAECFGKVLAMLRGQAINAKILKVDIYKYAILVSVSRPSMQESTDSKFDGNNVDVGIFLSETGQGKTEVRVNSFSSPFRDYTAKMVFEELQKKNGKLQNPNDKIN